MQWTRVFLRGQQAVTPGLQLFPHGEAWQHLPSAIVRRVHLWQMGTLQGCLWWLQMFEEFSTGCAVPLVAGVQMASW